MKKETVPIYSDVVCEEWGEGILFYVCIIVVLYTLIFFVPDLKQLSLEESINEKFCSNSVSGKGVFYCLDGNVAREFVCYDGNCYYTQKGD